MGIPVPTVLIHQRFVAELLDLALCSIPEEDDEKYEQDTEDEVGVCVCTVCVRVF